MATSSCAWRHPSTKSGQATRVFMGPDNPEEVSASEKTEVISHDPSTVDPDEFEFNDDDSEDDPGFLKMLGDDN